MKSQRSTEARRNCGLELYSEKVRHARDFISLGEKKAAEARLTEVPKEKENIYRCALSAFEAATAVDPRDPQPFLALGRFYLDFGNLLGAEKAYRDVLSVKLDATDAYLGLVEIAMRRGDEAAEILLLETMLQKSKNPPNDAYRQLGDLYEKSGHRSRARKVWKRYLVLLKPSAKEERARLRKRLKELSH